MMMNKNLVMSIGMKALRDTLGTVGAEVFIFNLRAEEPFNYTEWRRDNLFEDMSSDELLNAAAEFAKNNRPIFTKMNAVE